MNKYNIYTDASFRADKKIGACGFTVFRDNVQVVKLIKIIENDLEDNNEAERYAIMLALNYIMTNIDMHKDKISIYTDQEYIVDYIQNNKYLNIIKEIKQLTSTIKHKGCELVFVHVKSHQKRLHGNEHNKHHSMLDRSILTKLRNYIKNNYNGTI